MAGDSNQIVQKLWNYCNVLPDNTLSCGDHVEELAYLLFLKMANVRTKASYMRNVSGGLATANVRD